MTRTMPAPPPDLDEGVLKFLEFHDLNPKDIGTMKLTLPKRLVHLGRMSCIEYRSDKWEGKAHNYYHDHGSGVEIYAPDLKGDVETPNWIRQSQTLVRLGYCLGVYFTEDTGDEVFGDGDKSPMSELYATPCGHALVVTTGKSRIECIIFGGRLRVEKEGIKG